MQSRELEQFLAARTDRSASFLDQVARALRQVGMMPSGGRGVGAPHLQSKHVANFLIGAAMCRTAGEAPGIVKRYGSLVARVDLPFPEIAHGKQTGGFITSPLNTLGRPGEAVTFRAAFTALLEGRGRNGEVGKITLYRWPTFRGLMGVAMARCNLGEFLPRGQLDMTKAEHHRWFAAEHEVVEENVIFGDKFMAGIMTLMGGSAC